MYVKCSDKMLHKHASLQGESVVYLWVSLLATDHAYIYTCICPCMRAYMQESYPGGPNGHQVPLIKQRTLMAFNVNSNSLVFKVTITDTYVQQNRPAVSSQVLSPPPSLSFF